MSRFETAARVISEELGKPYALGGKGGATDCLILGLRVVDALRETEFAAEAVGLYATNEDVRKLLMARKYRGFGDIFSKHVKLKKITPSLAKVGDIAIIETTESSRMAEHVAVFNGRTFTTITDAGASSYGFDQVKACFKV